jgi:hypothetical protein
MVSASLFNKKIPPCLCGADECCSTMMTCCEEEECEAYVFLQPVTMRRGEIPFNPVLTELYQHTNSVFQSQRGDWPIIRWDNGLHLFRCRDPEYCEPVLHDDLGCLAESEAGARHLDVFAENFVFMIEPVKQPRHIVQIFRKMVWFE